MDWEKIVEKIPTVIERVRKDYILNNRIIKDDIFGILEKHCTVVYYPIENEINCGFHAQRDDAACRLVSQQFLSRKFKI